MTGPGLIARHEAGHAAAAVLAGLSAECCIELAPQPGRLAGWTKARLRPGQEDPWSTGGALRDHYALLQAMINLSGYLASGGDVARADGDIARAIKWREVASPDGRVHFLGQAHTLARTLTRSDRFRRLARPIAEALEAEGWLLPHEVDEIAIRAGFVVPSGLVPVGVWTDAGDIGRVGLRGARSRAVDTWT